MEKNLNNKRVERTPPVYIGPEYHKGITLPDNTMVSPKDFTTQQLSDFLRTYPEYATWWSEVSPQQLEDTFTIQDMPFGKMKIKNVSPPLPIE